MSNISDAFGEFQFDFSNVKKNPSEIASWLHKFKKALDKGDYFTTLDYITDEDFHKQGISNVVINFVANGQNAYQNNLKWITTEENNDAYKALLLTLSITIWKLAAHLLVTAITKLKFTPTQFTLVDTLMQRN